MKEARALVLADESVRILPGKVPRAAPVRPAAAAITSRSRAIVAAPARGLAVANTLSRFSRLRTDAGEIDLKFPKAAKSRDREVRPGLGLMPAATRPSDSK